MRWSRWTKKVDDQAAVREAASRVVEEGFAIGEAAGRAVGAIGVEQVACVGDGVAEAKNGVEAVG